MQVSGASTRKAYLGGTHRVRAPADTVEWAMERAPRVGITRVANVTGLDHLGVPVVMVVRPNSRCVSVAQGKGIDLDSARASGLMESIEAHHAETVELPTRMASYAELRRRERVADPTSLARPVASRFSPEVRLPWVSGRSLGTGDAVWVPLETVEIDATLPAAYLKGCFHLTSNGLASGNHLLEAIAHGLFEVVERDAMQRWARRPDRADTRIDLDAVEDPLTRSLLDRLDAADVALAAWDATSDIGIPCVHVTMIDRHAQPFRRVYPSQGQGCHHDSRVALLRATTEAAQARLTWIAGSRDDLSRSTYQTARASDHLDRVRTEIADESRPRLDPTSMPQHVHATLEDDVAAALAAITAAGADDPIVVDLTKPELGVPVVKVIAPGLAGDRDLGDSLPMPPGRRADT